MSCCICPSSCTVIVTSKVELNIACPVDGCLRSLLLIERIDIPLLGGLLRFVLFPRWTSIRLLSSSVIMITLVTLIHWNLDRLVDCCLHSAFNHTITVLFFLEDCCVITRKDLRFWLSIIVTRYILLCIRKSPGMSLSFFIILIVAL